MCARGPKRTAVGFENQAPVGSIPSGGGGVASPNYLLGFRYRLTVD